MKRNNKCTTLTNTSTRPSTPIHHHPVCYYSSC